MLHGKKRQPSHISYYPTRNNISRNRPKMSCINIFCEYITINVRPERHSVSILSPEIIFRVQLLNHKYISVHTNKNIFWHNNLSYANIHAYIYAHIYIYIHKTIRDKLMLSIRLNGEIVINCRKLAKFCISFLILRPLSLCFSIISVQIPIIIDIWA